jgi:hypothetical protein
VSFSTVGRLSEVGMGMPVEEEDVDMDDFEWELALVYHEKIISVVTSFQRPRQFINRVKNSP